MSYITPYHYSSIYPSSLQSSPDIQKITNILHHSLHTELIQALAVRIFSTLIAVTQIQNLHGIITRRKDERLIATINQSHQPLKNFNLSKDNLKRIMPYLEYANFQDCSLINEFTNEEFQELLDSSQNLKQLFINSDHIHSLAIPDSVTYLDLSNCTNLTRLDLSACTSLTHLDCSSCINLTDLHCTEYPQLVTLNLSNCTELTTLRCSRCPQLTTINLSNCTELTHLHSSRCPQLTTINLSNCTDLTTVFCADCSRLSTLDLSNNINLTHLHCALCDQLTTLNLSNCTGLTELYCLSLRITTLNLSDCENLRILDCSGCTQLTTLNVEALPQCNSLQCSRTPNLTQLPQLPQLVQIYGSTSFSNFTVDLANLEQNPLSVLLQLGRHHLLQNHYFPNIVFIDSRLDGRSPGIDAGGLRRHLVSTLFENLVQNEEFFTGEEENKLPVLASNTQEQDKKDYFRTIGRLFALCFTSPLLTGVHFDEHLFTTIQWIMNNSNPRPDNFDERVYCKLKGYDYECLDEDTREELPNHITENPIVYPTILIAEEMKATLQQSLIPEGLEFQRAIQGIEITSEKLLDKVTFRQGSEQERSDTQRFFRNWARDTQPENLVTFVKFATGSQSLGNNNITIELYPSRNSEQLPIVHSCSQILEMPIYPDQETFNEKINTALEFGGAEGFQFG